MNTETPIHTAAPAKRRAILLGAAALAGATGLGLSWWRQGGAAAASTPVQSPVPGFWEMQWETPSGKPLALQAFQGRPLLLNFWATWCPPCVEELPLINQFYQQHKAAGWQVLGLAIDKKSAVDPFLLKMPLEFPIALAGFNGTDLGRALGNLGGALPFSVVIGSSGSLLHRKMGRVSPEDLKLWAELK